MSDKDSFLHFLKKYINAPWVTGISPDDMERIDKSFITDTYSHLDSDIIYKLRMNETDVYFYILLELQSKVDFTMPYRLLRYMVELLDDIFRNTDEKERERKGFRLPAVVPMILYNGVDNWTVVREYKEYTENHEIFGDNIINFSYLLFDLNRTDGAFILSTKKLLDIVLSLDMANFADAALEEITERLTVLTSELTEDDFTALFGWIKYAYYKGEVPPQFEEEFQEIVKKGEVRTMLHRIEVLRDQRDQEWLNKGIEKGIEEGGKNALLQAAQKLLATGAEIPFIMQITGLAEDEVNRLAI